MARERRSQALSRYLVRFVLFGAFTLLCALALTDGAFFLAALLGIGTVFTGNRLLDRKGNRRRELWRWTRENARELSRVAREGVCTIRLGKDSTSGAHPHTRATVAVGRSGSVVPEIEDGGPRRKVAEDQAAGAA